MDRMDKVYTFILASAGILLLSISALIVTLIIGVITGQPWVTGK